MLASYDLHIHSVLSSCADDSQTPNNILNMVMLKELDMISITDHNSCKQYPTIAQLIDSYDYLLIYGIEAQVSEGFHVLSYFGDFKQMLRFDGELENYLDHDVKESYGQAIVCDEFDEVSEVIPYSLHQSLKLDLKEYIKLVRKYNGLVVLAHINRPGSTGFLKYYQTFSEFDIDAIEINGKENEEELEKMYPEIKNYVHLFNSDAHSVVDINEKENYLELEEISFEGFKKALLKGKKV